MASVRKNDILDSPFRDFARDCWLGCVSEIKTDSLGQEDFLLFITWGLDTIKRQDSKDDKRFRTIVYDALRNWLRENNEELEAETINYLANLICACCLGCFGLTLVDSMDNQDVYDDLMASMEGERSEVRKIKAKVGSDTAPELKEWVRAYLDNEVYYTKRDAIEWVGTRKKRTAKKDKIEEEEKGEGKRVRVKDPNAPMHLADDFDKANLFRIIIGLYKVGAFVTPKKKDISQKAVFESFGKMLGEDFGNYNNFLTDERYSELDIFREIQNAFSEYMKVKEKKRSSRK